MCIRDRHVTDGDVIAWHDTPHAVYLELGISTNFRFMHITTTLISPDHFWRASRELRKDALPHARFLVTDLLNAYRNAPEEGWRDFHDAGPDSYPPRFPAKGRELFPYCEPVVFRSGGGHGRYLVHRVTPDIVERLNDRRVKFEFEVKWWE